jgi:hypothetical protein
MATIEPGVTGRGSQKSQTPGMGHNNPPEDLPEDVPPPRKKKLQPRKKTLEQLGVCARTPERWERDPKLGFPPPTYINGRKYDDPDEIAEFIDRSRREGLQRETLVPPALADKSDLPIAEALGNAGKTTKPGDGTVPFKASRRG